MSWGAVIAGGAALAGSYMQGQAAKDAEGAQSAGQNRALSAQENMFNQAQQMSAPWRESGTAALSMLNDIYGLPTRTTPLQQVPYGNVQGGQYTPMSSQEQLQQFFSPGQMTGSQELQDFESSSVGGFLTPHSGKDPLSRLSDSLGWKQDTNQGNVKYQPSDPSGVIKDPEEGERVTQGEDPLKDASINRDYTQEELVAWAKERDGIGSQGHIKDFARNTMPYADYMDWAQSVGGVNRFGGLKDWTKEIIDRGAVDYYDRAGELGGLKESGAMRDWALQSAGEQSQIAQQEQAAQAQQEMQQQLQQQQANMPVQDPNVPEGFRAPDRNRALEAFQTNPGYQFQLDQANQAAQRGLAAQGLSGSGAELKELQRLAQGQANQGFNEYIGGLRSMAGLGQTSASQGANQAMSYGVQQGQNATNQGAIAAQGAINRANVGTSLLGQASQIYGQYQGMQSQPPQTNLTNAPQSGYGQAQNQFSTPYQPFSQYQY